MTPFSAVPRATYVITKDVFSALTARMTLEICFVFLREKNVVFF